MSDQALLERIAGHDAHALADLYDRFAPPVEWRFSEREVMELYTRAGFERVEGRPYRGWVTWGFKCAARDP